MSVNRSNAHVRSSTAKRGNPETLANEGERLLNDPAFIAGYDRVHTGIVRALENFKSDGSEESDNVERELCRTLRTLKSVRLAIAAGVQGNKLRLAGFKPDNSDTED